MYFSKIKLFKFQNRLIVVTLKCNNAHYLDVFDHNLNHLNITINLTSCAIEWLTANEVNIFCLSSKGLTVYDWTGEEICQSNVFSREFLNAIPPGATQIELYQEMFIFKCQNDQILILNKNCGSIIAKINSKYNFLIDSINNRMLILDNNAKLLTSYSFDMDLLTNTKLNNFPNNLKIHLNKNSDFLFFTKNFQNFTLSLFIFK